MSSDAKIKIENIKDSYSRVNEKVSNLNDFNDRHLCSDNSEHIYPSKLVLVMLWTVHAIRKCCRQQNFTYFLLKTLQKNYTYIRRKL